MPHYYDGDMRDPYQNKDLKLKDCTVTNTPTKEELEKREYELLVKELNLVTNEWNKKQEELFAQVSLPENSYRIRFIELDAQNNSIKDVWRVEKATIKKVDNPTNNIYNSYNGNDYLQTIRNKIERYIKDNNEPVIVWQHIGPLIEVIVRQNSNGGGVGGGAWLSNCSSSYDYLNITRSDFSTYPEAKKWLHSFLGHNTKEVYFNESGMEAKV